MKGFAQLSLAALATYVSAISVDLNKRESPLSVVLSASGNTEVKVAVTNNGDRTLNLLSKGTFLDEENPVEKVSIYSTSGSKFISQVLSQFFSHRCLESDPRNSVFQVTPDERI
jgi:deuterolysin